MSYLVKIVLICVILGAIRILGKPSSNTAQELNSARPKRQLGFVVLGGALTGVAIDNSFKCSDNGGCYKGYCWNYCGLSLSSGDWCYSTKTYSQSYDYVRCDKDSDCNLCWKCAGPCTV